MVDDDHNDDDVVSWIEGIRDAASRRYPMTPHTFHYGDAPEQVVDLWGDPEASTLVLSLHGGYFMQMYDRSLNEPLCRALAVRGVCAANADYRRAGSTDDPADSVRDVRAALDAVLAYRAHAPRYVVVTGHSAGGYLALTLVDHPAVTDLIPLAPVTDLERCHAELLDDGAIEVWVGASPEADAERWNALRLRPEEWVSVEGKPRVHIVHGDRDVIVPLQHSHDFEARASDTSLPLVVEVLVDTGHFEFVDDQSAGARYVVDLISLINPIETIEPIDSLGALD
ncbi:MAG: prolyl oligopeptidase family serine peptidase [Actinobacteria bacterium]|nr:prolyl oligopeptidase family serine peptidase [Actinomycetota bacterium]